MSLLAISDLHLRPATRIGIDTFHRFLSLATRNGDEVVIAGDLFDLWFGAPQLTFDYQREVLDQMQRSAKEGLILYYVEGNRDFAIRHYSGKIFRSVSMRYLDLKWQGKNIRIIHGDLVNRKDKLYRLWRAASKNPISLFLLDRMPHSFLNFGNQIEKEMKTTNMKFRATYPQEQIVSACKKASRDAVDILIAGHFHLERSMEVQVDQKNMLFYNLPGWESGFRYLVIPDNGNEKPYFTELTK